MKLTRDKLAPHIKRLMKETGAGVVFLLIGDEIGGGSFSCTTPSFRELAAALREIADQVEEAERQTTRYPN